VEILAATRRKVNDSHSIIVFAGFA
jgi:hypothetical protein